MRKCVAYQEGFLAITQVYKENKMDYPMTITSENKDTFIFVDGKHTRKLSCPNERRNQISECKRFYNFDSLTRLKYHVPTFKFSNKIQKTSSLFAKRLWDGLWEEGWR